MNNSIENRLEGMIGLAARGRMLVAGTDLACDVARSGKAKALLVCNNASKNTQKRVFNCAKYYEVACYEIPCSCESLGRCIGKSGYTATLALIDKNMANGIIKLLEQYNTGEGEKQSPQEV